MNLYKLRKIIEMEKEHQKLTRRANRLGLFSLQADIILKQRDNLQRQTLELKQEYDRVEGSYSQDKEVYDLIMDAKKLNQVLLLGLLIILIVSLFL